MQTGWIKLHREIADHWVWNCEFSAGQAWVDLLCHACHKPNKITIKGQLIELARGDQARSEVTLSKSWKWSRNKVRRFLKNLENDGMIEQKATHLTSIISICNYDDFQGDETTSETPKGQVSKHLKDKCRNTNKNVNKENNEKNTEFDAPPLADQSQKPSRFAPPIIEEIYSFSLEKGFDSMKEVENFFYFYDSKNWMVGKNKMQKWKSAYSRWISGKVAPVSRHQQKPTLTAEERQAITDREMKELMESFQ